jgi:hypothetical protein
MSSMNITDFVTSTPYSLVFATTGGLGLIYCGVMAADRRSIALGVGVVALAVFDRIMTYGLGYSGHQTP